MLTSNVNNLKKILKLQSNPLPNLGLFDGKCLDRIHDNIYKKMSKNFKLGKYQISENSCPIFLSEIGAFFGKDLNLAFKMISEISKISKKLFSATSS